MKKTFLALALSAVALLTCSCASTRQLSPTYLPPSVRPVAAAVSTGQAKVSEAQKHVTTAQTHAKAAAEKVKQIETATSATPEVMKLAQDASVEIDQLTTELTSTQEALTRAQTALADAQERSHGLQNQINAQTQTLNTTIETSNANAAKAAATEKAYHRLKFLVIGLAMALTAFLIYSIFRFAAFAPPLLYLLIAAPAAVGAALLFLI